MISRNSEGGFFAAHWDWLVAGAGVVALIVGIALFVMSGGGDPDEKASAVVNRLRSAKKADTGVKPIDMTPYERALQFAVKPLSLAEVADEGGNFLVSERRVFCQVCKKPIKDGTKVCPFCGEAQPEPEKPVADTDGDGLPDDWETKHGLDPAQNDADADKDGDGFTNAEEFAAGTDPSDKNSHPDYFDSLKIVLPLKEKVLPFYLRSYMKTPSGMKGWPSTMRRPYSSKTAALAGGWASGGRTLTLKLPVYRQVRSVRSRTLRPISALPWSSCGKVPRKLKFSSMSASTCRCC